MGHGRQWPIRVVDLPSPQEQGNREYHAQQQLECSACWKATPLTASLSFHTAHFFWGTIAISEAISLREPDGYGGFL